jgi:lipopolysaccharide transport system ATP-binding protein
VTDIAIRVENLGKRYRRGIPSGHDRLSETLVNLGRLVATTPRRWLRGPAAGPDRAGEFWALKDVSFEVKRGEVVGVIGRNGAGKSTLLKVLSRITEPTAGRFGLRGRVGSLLEVGTGFHGELTGRENVFLSGTLLGMTRREVQRKLDAIVAFAEVDDFLDTPVKRYSSGMQMRLGFAVAAHLEPEILVVDEVLAVGDAAFQKKCLGKMGEVAAEGRTVLFVSHNLAPVQRLCGLCVLLERGRLAAFADTRTVIDRYSAAPAAESGAWSFTAPDAAAPHFRSVALCDSVGRTGVEPDTAAAFGLAIEFAIPRRTSGLLLAVAVANREGVYLFATSPTDAGRLCPTDPGVYRTVVSFPSGLFMPKAFGLVAALYTTGRVFHSVDQMGFGVADAAAPGAVPPGDRVGELRVRCDWGPFAPAGAA